MGGLLAVNSPIRQALAADGFQRCISALNVIEAVSRAVVPFEIELRCIALQMALRHAVESAIQAALEDGE